MKRIVLAFPLKASLHRTSDFRKLLFIGLICSLLVLGLATASFGQADQSNLQFTEGQVNDSGTLSLSVPLRSYKGRGLDLPIALS